MVQKHVSKKLIHINSNDYPQKLLKFQILYFGALHLYFYSGYYFYQYNGALHLPKGQSPDILVENTSRKSTKVQRTEI